MSTKIGFMIARIIAIILLLGALGSHPYAYYTLLRVVVCGITAYGAYYSIILKEIGWAWTYGVIAFLFNPIIPVYLNMSIWTIIDIGVAIVIIVSLFILRKPTSKEFEGNSLE